MANLRLISARLLNEVSDKISQDLGYRYHRVWIKGLGWLDPSPRVRDVTGKYFPDSTYARWLGVLDALPNKVWEIRVPKMIQGTAITEADLRTLENWKVETESAQTVSVKPLDIESKNSHFIVLVAVLKAKLT